VEAAGGAPHLGWPFLDNRQLLHMQDVVKEPPAALEPPPAPTRVRPLIYIYDLEPLYSTKLLQYRWGAAAVKA
jgi:hypothetical protein